MAAKTIRAHFSSKVHRALVRMGKDASTIGDGASHLSSIVRSMTDTGMLMNGFGAYQIIELVKATGKIPGALAEVGVFRGGTARLICEAKGDRDLHLFDTWEGLPEPTEADRGSGFRNRDYVASMQETSKYLSGYSGVHFYQGLFPATADRIRDLKFSFVHLDVDLYVATVSGLEFFYPRMSRGGVIISHDYYSPGVRTAVDEFFRDKPEIVVQQPASAHCIIVKL
jgi:O-methyltransferase